MSNLSKGGEELPENKHPCPGLGAGVKYKVLGSGEA